MYDVLDLAWSEFSSRANKGKTFRTLLLIRETFADSEEFSVTDYADRLEQTFPGLEVNVRYHQSEPESLSVSEAARLLRTPTDIVLPNAPNFFDLKSSSHAIKPGVTRLARFQLLDRLVRGAKAQYSGRSGKRSFLTPFDVGNYQSLEIFGSPGAFSGAHMDASGGTWLRNRFGTKLWMIVPQSLMTDRDWLNLSEGPSWDPGTKSRAIILRPGDVFFMPPDIAVIHAVLTLETCLMDGRMLWDEATLLPLLRTLHWIGRNQKATNEALPYQLGEVLNQLERVLALETCGTPFGNAEELDQAIRDLRSLGCDCDWCNESCPCAEQDRRCTPLYSGYAIEPGTKRGCFEEPTAEDSEGVGSLFGIY